MTKRLSATCLAAALLMGAVPAFAEPEIASDELNINGDTPVVTTAPAAEFLKGHLDTVYSGWLFREDDTRKMEQDDFENPNFVFVDKGQDAWDTVDGSEGKSCASCHNDVSDSMKGVRATMPKINAAGDLWSIEDYINDCRTKRMGAEKWKWNSEDMKNMTLLISIQSRGMPVNVAIDGPAAPHWEKGKEMYYTRYGQLELSCANCHEQNYGNYIRADHLSQGQTNGFPVYRLKDAGVVSIHQRFTGCIRDTRGETFAAGSPEFHDLELYVASRGTGLGIEGAGVRP